MSNDTLHRFSDRVDNYVKYRPHYPTAVFDFLESEGIVASGGVIADIGSGTGISAEPLLKRGYTVYGIEPNKEMREAAETFLAPYPNFKSTAAAAERTTLEDSSADLVL